jgi:hypothetical protein
MSRRLLSLLFGAIFFALAIPTAKAADIPILTWERGKVQNIVVGDAIRQTNWTIKLLSEKNSEITFTRSTVNSRGFIVYSGDLPSNLPIGQYSIVVFGDGSSSGTQISQVHVIKLKHFSILNSTHDVGILGISLTFILAFFSTLKAKKYSFLSFFREDKLIEDGSLLYAKSIPRFAYKYYLHRIHSLKGFKPSLIKFLLEYDDSFLHKLSPLLWVLLPTIGLVAGIQGGLATGHQPLKFQFYSLALLTTISLIDAYSAVFVVSGFAIALIVLGEVMNIRAIVEISALGLAWVGTGLLSSHLQLLIQQEMRRRRRYLKTLPKKISLVVGSSLITSVLFYLSFLLAESVSDNEVIPRQIVITVAILVSLLAALKFFIHEAQDIRIFRSSRVESLKDNHHEVRQLITPFWAGVIVFGAFCVAFVWTEDWKIALLFGLLNVIYFGLLIIQFSSHKLRYVLRWDRSIVTEPSTLALLSYLAFAYIDRLPLQTSDRSMLFILSVYVIAILHGILSNVLEITKTPVASQ